jgi:hypothetical protein
MAGSVEPGEPIGTCAASVVRGQRPPLLTIEFLHAAPSDAEAVEKSIVGLLHVAGLVSCETTCGEGGR